MANAVSPEVNLIFGTVIDENLGDTVRITVIATGFGGAGSTQQSRLDLGADNSSSKRPSFLNNAPVGSSASVRQAAPAPAPQGGAADFDIPDFLKRKF